MECLSPPSLHYEAYSSFIGVVLLGIAINEGLLNNVQTGNERKLELTGFVVTRISRT